ncbi:GNAT family N-acetyltransferase [Pukyongiella litopenaei]|uniref:GNAT family N-acetyltransferase n=1 Tax=Pukyongiella litopenaei TaxID=2605946 RepID=A0A2S0MQ94_9RHOB|nr:GNAT family N-acetyltransferase [Pukyongiella litopenaei]AVO38052.1 GNAT family N-acetyltransferase [Pukyongiella litopenaei]
MPADTPNVVLRDYRRRDRAWVTAANLRHYRTVEGFDAGFEDAIVAALDLLERHIDDETSTFLIAEADGRPVGCVFFCADTGTAGRVRLFYLDKAQRGRGLGRRMMTRIIDRARASGFETIRVSTFDRHRAACRLYAALGFDRTTRARATVFGQPMRQVDFELGLTGPRADEHTG